MMRKKIFCGLCIVAALWACSESPLPLEGLGEAFPIELQGEVVQQYVTRASDGGFATGDQVGIYIVNHENGQPQPLQVVGNHADNVRYTYDAEQHTWTSSYPLYWKDKTTHADAYGYYPYDAELRSVEDYPFSIRRDQREAAGYEHSDFLWAKAEDVAPGTPIYLKYQHLMAGIQVTLIEGEDFEAGEWAPADKSVLVENIATDTYINIGTGEVGISRKSAIQGILPQQRGTVWRAVVPAQTLAADQPLLAITVNGESYHFQRSEAMTYLPGKLHKFTIRVDKRLPKGDYQFTLVSEAITAWENDAESHNGAAREYFTIDVQRGESLIDVIKSMGKDPASIKNLKIKGILGFEYEKDHGDRWHNAEQNCRYIREQMPQLEAINMKELRFERVSDHDWKKLSDYSKDYNDYIPWYAFENMANLKYVVWPDSLKGIGYLAFAGSTLQGSLILPEGLEYIGSAAFGAYGHRTGNLTGELYIPSTVEYIGDGAFERCMFTNELVLPEKMLYLGANAFNNCKYMTGTVHVPDGLEEVNASWTGMERLSGAVVIPQGVKKVNGIGCPIVSIEIPEGVTEIGTLNEISWQPWQPYADYRKRLGYVKLPTTLRKIGEQAFAGCGFAHIKMYDGIEVIPTLAFAHCELQDTLTLPSTVTKIENQAFYHCDKLSAVILPENVQIIGEFAFCDCFSLDYIQCLGSAPPAIADNAFSGVEKDNFTVVVPEGAVDAYRNAPGWNEFKRISAYRNFVCRPMQAKLLNKSNVRDIVLNADEAWTVKSCPSWMHLDKSSGYKKTELKVTIDALPHGSEDRTDSIVFQLNRNDEYGEPITCYYKVQQFDYEYEEDGLLQLQKATRGQRGGIDIMFVGDGYDAEDLARGNYRTDMEEEMEYFFDIEPYKTYKDYFNVTIAMAMSYESGVVDSPDKWRNTKFGITYGAGNNGRLLVDFDEIGRYVLQDIDHSPVTAANIGRSLIICVPNSDAYEGITAMYTDGSAIAICPHSRFDYPNDARGLIQHEAGGHGWGKLGDEYIYHRAYIQTCICTCCGHVDVVQSAKSLGWFPNLSLQGRYSTNEWKQLISHPKYSDIVDIYEGGFMHSRGIYRPEVNSCMNNNVPYYNTVSRQAMVERIMEAAGETFDFDEFVSKDSRDWGNKFLTRSQQDVPWQQIKAVYSDHHGPLIKQGSPVDYLKKGGKQ